MTKHLPNILTLCNLACGCFGIVAVFNGDLTTGSIMIWVGALFDFFDGLAARLLNSYSAIGKDLDSLADLITFCFLPGSILYVLIRENYDISWIAFSGFLIVIFGALRLAKFNNDTRSPEYFYGLPVPASGIFVSAFSFADYSNESFLSSPIVLIGIPFLLSILMISNIRLMSLKFANLSLSGNWNRYILLISSIILLATLHVLAIPVIIISYVVFSIALNIAE